MYFLGLDISTSCTGWCILDSEMDFGDKISLCYAGNLGEAHDECFLRHVIDSIDPKKHVLLLALYGVKAKKIIDYREKYGVHPTYNTMMTIFRTEMEAMPLKGAGSFFWLCGRGPKREN